MQTKLQGYSATSALGGRPVKDIQEARRSLERYSLKVVTPKQIGKTFQTLFHIRDSSNDDRARVLASSIILERGLGKARPAPDDSGAGDRLTDIRLRLLAQENDRLRKELEELKQGQIVQGTYVEIPQTTETTEDVPNDTTRT